nr:MAG: capsid protein [Cressdnaviricota sp.]
MNDPLGVGNPYHNSHYYGRYSKKAKRWIKAAKWLKKNGKRVARHIAVGAGAVAAKRLKVGESKYPPIRGDYDYPGDHEGKSADFEDNKSFGAAVRARRAAIAGKSNTNMVRRGITNPLTHGRAGNRTRRNRKRSVVVRSKSSGKYKGKRTLRKVVKKEKNLEKRVRKLENFEKIIETVGIFRGEDFQHLGANINTCGYALVGAFSKGQIDGVLANLKFWDIKIPGTQLVVDLTATNNFEKIVSLKARMTIVARNNDKVPVNVCLYTFQCLVDVSVADTFTDPLECYIAQAPLEGIATPATDMYHTIMDCYPAFKHEWKLVKKVRKTLHAGEELFTSHSVSIPKFDTIYPKLSAKDAYTRAGKGFVTVARVEGMLCHDNANATLVGVSDCGLDLRARRQIVCKYNGGLASHYYVGFSSTGGTVTTPVVDDLSIAGYSDTVTK